MDKKLVFELVQMNWLDLSKRECQKKRNLHFLNYMNENCSNTDIKSLFSESTPDGVFEMLYHLGEHLMSCTIEEDTQFPFQLFEPLKSISHFP